MVTRPWVTATVILLLAATQVRAAVLTEDFQDGNISANPIWATLAGSGSVVTDPGTGADPENKVLRFTANNTRLSTDISAIAAGSTVSVTFKTMKSGSGNNLSIGLLDANGAGIVFAHDMNTNVGSEGNYVYVGSTSDALLNVGSKQSIKNDDIKFGAGTGLWHTVQITWNRSDNKVSAAIDGVSLGTITYGTAVTANDLTQIVIKGTFSNSAYMDGILVNVPEPASLGLLTVGGLSLLLRRR